MLGHMWMLDRQEWLPLQQVGELSIFCTFHMILFLVHYHLPQVNRLLFHSMRNDMCPIFLAPWICPSLLPFFAQPKRRKRSRIGSHMPLLGFKDCLHPSGWDMAESETNSLFHVFSMGYHRITLGYNGLSVGHTGIYWDNRSDRPEIMSGTKETSTFGNPFFNTRNCLPHLEHKTTLTLRTSREQTVRTSNM